MPKWHIWGTHSVPVHGPWQSFGWSISQRMEPEMYATMLHKHMGSASAHRLQGQIQAPGAHTGSASTYGLREHTALQLAWVAECSPSVTSYVQILLGTHLCWKLEAE